VSEVPLEKQDKKEEVVKLSLFQCLVILETKMFKVIWTKK